MNLQEIIKEKVKDAVIKANKENTKKGYHVYCDCIKSVNGRFEIVLRLQNTSNLEEYGEFYGLVTL